MKVLAKYGKTALCILLAALVMILTIGAVDAANRGTGFLFISSFTPTPTQTETNTAVPTEKPTETLSPIATETAVPTATATQTPVPTDTLTPLPTFDETAFAEKFYQNVTETAVVFYLMQTPTITPTLADSELYTGLEMTNQKDRKSLIYIKTTTDRSDQLGFWIDWNEVTNAEYLLCIASGTCTPPSATHCGPFENYFQSVEFAGFPVVNITQKQAAEYCRWAEMDMMTLSDWETACNIISSEEYNIDQKEQMPSVNESSNLVGNVWEWTSDRTDKNNGIIVGGSWKSSMSDIVSGRVGYLQINESAEDVGFRCVRYVR